MSRSSGPGAHPTGLPQQRPQAPATGWPQPQQDPQAWPPQSASNGWSVPQGHQGHYGQQGYQQPAQQAYAPQQAPAPASDPLSRGGEYHYPQTQPAAAADPYAQQRAAAAPRTAPPAAQPQYAPQFDAYVPTTRPTAPPAAHAKPQQPAYQGAPAHPAPPHPAYAPAASSPQRQVHPLQQALQAGTAAGQLRGTTHEHWPTAAAPQPQAYQPPQAPAYQPQAEQHGYDLGHYAPADQQRHEPTLTRPAAQQDWAQQAGYGHDAHGTYPQTDPAQPSLDPSGYHNDQQGGYETGQQLTAGQDYEQDDGEYEEEEEPRRRSKGLIIVAALVGAIGLGGGLAYAYKTLLAPGGDKGKVPIVKNDKAPTKVAPVTPGGKQFANSDTKVLNADAGNKLSGRLNDSGGTGSSASGDADGVKRVSTVVVGRDGTMTPSAPPSPPATSSPLPGMVISDGGLGPRPLPPQQPQVQPQQQAAVAPPQQPRTIVATPSVPSPPAQPAARAPAPPAPAVVSAADAAKATSVSAPKKQAVPLAKPTYGSAGVGSGYVAVLSSQRSQAEALQVFAGLRQKYPDLLQNRQPGVQEANIPEKGVYHRLVAGPAGAKEDADALCMQLKASGHSSCWVTAVK